ncbi:MAG: NADH-quinone oxidoreductase subunit L [Planctomycetota bacterium]
MLVAAADILSLPAYATLPLWPLVGAALAGLLLALRTKPGVAAWPVVLGVLISAILGVTLFFDLTPAATAHDEHGSPPPAIHTAGASEAEHGAAGGNSESVTGNSELGTRNSKLVTRNSELPGLTYTVYNWISLGAEPSLARGHWFPVNFYFDGLTGVMLLFVTVVSLMVVIYSVGYMRDHHGHPEPGYERFFAFMGLFVFSMLTLVLAGNFVLLYLGWELVGLCSYLLIGFYYERPSAAEAAKKAFIVNRIGDFGFALGVFAIYYYLVVAPGAASPVQPGENPLDYSTVFKYAGWLASHESGMFGWSQATVVSLLLLCGAIGKSAQFPLYVWLPDAMEGPTPVSALIHAATMVTAGIYMVARCTPIFQAAPLALDVIITLGVVGALLTATMAMAQYDMKRILAYSTISQLAFMFVALGCAAPAAGVFHVFTHAWFKALLFLGAGSVMHAMGGVIDLRRFSGLRHVLPKTYAVMWIGCLSLAGFPLLAGFWSKDEIVHAAFERSPFVGVLLLLTAGLTAYYTFRMFFLCFFGPLRLPDAAGAHPHESPPVMLWPLYVLAAGAVLAGYLGVTLGLKAGAFLGLFSPHGFYHGYVGASTIDPSLALGARPVAHPEGGAWLMYVSAAVALAGIALAWWRYGRVVVPETAADPDARALGGLWRLWHAKYYVDEVYDAVFVRPLRNLGRGLFATDQFGIDALVDAVGRVPRSIGFVFGLTQRGALQTYALGMALGLAVLLAIWGLWVI